MEHGLRSVIIKSLDCTTAPHDHTSSIEDPVVSTRSHVPGARENLCNGTTVLQ